MLQSRSLIPKQRAMGLQQERECDNLIEEWHTTFKSSDLNFLHLLNNDLSEIEPSYTKGGL